MSTNDDATEGSSSESGHEERSELSSYAGGTRVGIKDYRLGIWKVYVAVPPSQPFDFQKLIGGGTTSFGALRLFCTDAYKLSPWLSIAYVLGYCWAGIDEAILLYSSAKLLRVVEHGFVTGEPDVRQIMTAIGVQVGCSLLSTFQGWISEKIAGNLKRKIESHFELLLLKARLAVDLPTSLNASSDEDVSAEEAIDSFEQISWIAKQALTIASNFSVIVHSSQLAGGTLLCALSVIQPLLSTLFPTDYLWNKVCFGYVDNEDYKRMKALNKMSDSEYRQDVISSNLAGWLVEEHQKVHFRVADIPREHPRQQFPYQFGSSPMSSLLSAVLADFPMIYCALCAVIMPSKLSIVSIGILQQSASALRLSMDFLMHSGETLRESITTIRNLYDQVIVTNSLRDGELPYPLPESANQHDGMSFDLQGVSFSYPGDGDEAALENIDLSIKAGQLIVIVGSNGSGKSTLIRILNRLYDPSSGQLLIDGRPSSDYRMGDLHRASVILSQDNVLFPLSLGENIGLGLPEQSNNVEMIKEAAKLGGASNFIAKLTTGLETELVDLLDTFSHNLHGDTTHPLYAMMKNKQKKIDISGGEQQRVAASRAFMRFQSKGIKFVAVDEPSSALDAEGELQLFNRLIASRGGKTMIFVTHRFGHLTKVADQILCMKGGSIVETGSHSELMQMGGEYANLYNIQASAFTSDEKAPNDTPHMISSDELC